MRTSGALAFLLFGAAAYAAPTFHADVEPILQRRCQGCHRPGDIGPMALIRYDEVRPWAKAIRSAVLQKKMPPWFADAAHGSYANDPSLSKAELETLTAWVDAGAPRGNPKDAPKPLEFFEGWRIGKPDVVVQIPKPFQVPASGVVPYQYISVPTGFTEDKWVEAIEIRPSNRKVVHHINASATPGGAGAPAADFRTSDLEQRLLKSGREIPEFAEGELLETFVPGGAPPMLKKGQAKLIKAGSNINFQLHYTTTGKPEEDQTSIGFRFAKEPPKERIKGILVFNRLFTIPAGAANHPVSARAAVLRDVRLVSVLPHMHLRGKDFEVRVTYPSGESETVLRVPNYDFNWQINYYLAAPKLLPKGSILEVSGHFDNSPNNPHNPDPSADVRYGEQTWEEMLNGFMEVAMDPVAEAPPVLGKAPVTSSANAAPRGN
jgi:hypothetical protein